MKMNNLIDAIMETIAEGNHPGETLRPLLDALISQYTHDLRMSVQLSSSAKVADILAIAFQEAR